MRPPGKSSEIVVSSGLSSRQAERKAQNQGSCATWKRLVLRSLRSMVWVSREVSLGVGAGEYNDSVKCLM